MIDLIRVSNGSEGTRPLAEMLSRASAALNDTSASAEERIRRADSILQKLALRKPVLVDVSEACRAPRRGGLANWQIGRLQSFIELNLGNVLSVTTLADLARLSPQHFSRAFRISFDEAPHRYLTRLRVERAFFLMRTTGASLVQIAAECGFSDQSHFNRVFRKITGGSPGVWRRAQKNHFDEVKIDGSHLEVHRVSHPSQLTFDASVHKRGRVGVPSAAVTSSG